MAADDCRKIAIADLVLKVAACERNIEVRRQQTCIKKDFQAYVAFSRICRDGSHAMTAAMVHKFLFDSTLDSSQRDCQAFIERYDQDGDGCLSFKEFLEAILPKEHPDLRAYVSQQECFTISRDEYLSYDTECKLAKLLYAEVNLFEAIVAEKEAVIRQNGLTASKVISLVDGGSSANLNFSNLQAIFNSTGVLPYDAEIINFIRRLDKDGDGVINQDELADFLNEYRGVERSNRRSGSHIKAVNRRDSPETLSEEHLRKLSPNRRIIEQGVKQPAQNNTRRTSDLDHSSRTGDSRANIGRSERSPIDHRQRDLYSEASTRSLHPASTSRMAKERDPYPNYVEKTHYERRVVEEKDRKGQVTSLNLNPPREQYRKALESQIQVERESPSKNRYYLEQRDRELNSRLGTSASKPNLSRNETVPQLRGTPVKRPTRDVTESKDESIDRLKISRVSPMRDHNLPYKKADEPKSFEPSHSLKNFKNLRPEHDNSDRKFDAESNIFKNDSENRSLSSQRKLSGRDHLKTDASSLRDSSLPMVSQYKDHQPSESKSRLALGDHSVEGKSSDTLYKACKLIMNQERNLELARRELVSKSDFDVSEIFSRIDKRNRTWFTIEDFRVYLSEIGLKNIETRALIDLYSSYDTNQSCLLNFEQLVSMLCPLDGKYAAQLNKADRKVSRTDSANQRIDLGALGRRVQPHVQR